MLVSIVTEDSFLAKLKAQEIAEERGLALEVVDQKALLDVSQKSLFSKGATAFFVTSSLSSELSLEEIEALRKKEELYLLHFLKDPSFLERSDKVLVSFSDKELLWRYFQREAKGWGRELFFYLYQISSSGLEFSLLLQKALLAFSTPPSLSELQAFYSPSSQEIIFSLWDKLERKGSWEILSYISSLSSEKEMLLTLGAISYKLRKTLQRLSRFSGEKRLAWWSLWQKVLSLEREARWDKEQARERLFFLLFSWFYKRKKIV